MLLVAGKGRIAEAEKSLQWLRGWVQPPDVQIELAHLVKSLQSSYEQRKQKSRSWEPYLKRTFLRPYLIVSMMFFFGHLGGMTTLQTYAVSFYSFTDKSSCVWISQLWNLNQDLKLCLSCYQLSTSTLPLHHNNHIIIIINSNIIIIISV